MTMTDKEERLFKAIFGDIPKIEDDCDTCPYMHECMHEDKDGGIYFDVNGCKM